MCALTNQPGANLIKCMVSILSPPFVFLGERSAFKLDITRVFVLSMRLNIPIHVCTRAAHGLIHAFTLIIAFFCDLTHRNVAFWNFVFASHGKVWFYLFT